MLPLAGRCACGLLLTLIHREDTDDHLSCNGAKKCLGCHEGKPLSEFWKYGKAKNFRPYARCKTCWRNEKRARYQEHTHTRERIKANARKYYLAHKLQVLDRKIKNYRDRQEQERAKARAYREKNRDKEVARQKRYWATFGKLLRQRRKVLSERRKAA